MITVVCDRCTVESIFMGETYAQARHVYTLPNKWRRAEDVDQEKLGKADPEQEWAHLCPFCVEVIEGRAEDTPENRKTWRETHWKAKP